MTLVFTPDPGVIKLWTDNKSFHHKINRPSRHSDRNREESHSSGPVLQTLKSSSRFIAES